MEVDLSAILDPFGSDQFMSCPRAVSFFQRLCPAPFPPVSGVGQGCLPEESSSKPRAERFLGVWPREEQCEASRVRKSLNFCKQNETGVSSAQHKVTAKVLLGLEGALGARLRTWDCLL